MLQQRSLVTDINLLPINDSHIFLTRSNGLFTKVVQRKIVNSIPQEERCSHAGVIITCPVTNKKIIIESHIKTGGVRAKTVEEFVSQLKEDKIFIYQYPINTHTAFTLAEQEIPYGIMELVGFSAGIQGNPNGMICSDFVAATLQDRKFCKMKGVPYSATNKISPPDIQEFLLILKSRLVITNYLK